MFEAEFWVAVAFVIFLGVLGYVGVHKTIVERARPAPRPHQGRARRGAPAEGRGAEAARRIPAQADARREGEAEAIIAGAKAEAERLAAEAKAKLEDFVARRTKMAETKIAQAEAQALADVRSAAADAAVGAAEKVLAPGRQGQDRRAADRARASRT